MNVTKFKVGDKVRILDGSRISNYFGSWIDGMTKYVGKVCTIDDIYEKGWRTGYHMKEIGYMWDERALELAEDKPKHKFKVGDTVIAKKNNGYGITTDGWRGVVTGVDDHWFKAKGPAKCCISQEFNALEYDCFDLVIDEKIIITHDGKTTTAKLHNGKKVTKTAHAKCNPNDKFDFNIGAAIALERLTGCAYGHLESTVDSDLQWNRFMAGKIGLKVPKEKVEKFLEKCNACKVRWASGEPAMNWNPLEDSDEEFAAYVYMYNDDDGLLYCRRQFSEKPCEVWEDDSFDWDGFKAGKFNVITTRDSISRFLEECDAHQISYSDQKATGFNPIKDFEKLPPFLKTTLFVLLNANSTDECEFKVKDGTLVYSFDFKVKESTVRYD